MNIKPSTTTRFIDKLEVKGLVKRKTEGKSSHLYPTQKGIDLKGEIDECLKSLHKRYSGILGYDRGVELTESINEATIKLEKNIYK